MRAAEFCRRIFREINENDEVDCGREIEKKAEDNDDGLCEGACGGAVEFCDEQRDVDTGKDEQACDEGDEEEVEQ